MTITSSVFKPFMNFVSSEDLPSINKLMAVLSILYSKQINTKIITEQLMG